MRRSLMTCLLCMICLAGSCLITGLVASHAEGHGSRGCTSCTDTAVHQQCVPACKGSWDEKTSAKPKYTMTCEYACARGRDSWHAPSPECRCSPPCGAVFVKKKAYKTDGEETVERVPKYEVTMVAAEPCDCASCSGDDRLCWWNPLALVRRCGIWW